MSNDNRQEVAAGLEAAPKQSSKKWIIASIVALIVLISAVVVYGFMSSKSPKDAYLVAELKSYEKAQADFESNYGKYLDLQEKMENEPYTSEMDISGNFDVQLADVDPQLAMVQAVLGQINISVDQKADINNDKQYAKIGVELQGNTLADAEFVQSGESLGVRVPLAYTDFLYLDTTKFGEFMRTMDPNYFGPETLNLDTIKLSDIKLTDDEKEKLKATYGEVLVDNLAEENFTRENGVGVTINGTKVKADKIQLELSEQEIQKLLEAFLSTAAKDKNLQDIIIARYELIATTDPTLYSLSTDEVREMLVAGLEEAAGSVDEFKLESGIQSTIWVNSDDTIVQREIKFEVAEEGIEPVQFVLSTYNVENDGKTQKEFKVSVTGANETAGYFAITSETKGKDADRTSNVDVTFNATEAGEELINIVLAIDSEYEKGEGSAINGTHNFQLDIKNSSAYDPIDVVLSGTVEETEDINLAKDYANSEFSITINAENKTIAEGGTITLNVANKTEFMDTIDVPSLEGGVNLTELSEQELMSLTEEMMTNLQNAVYGLMGQFGGF